MIAIHLSKKTLYSCPTVLVLSMLFSSVRTSYAFEAAQSRARRSDRKYNAELVASLGASFSARGEAGDGQADDGFDGTHVVYPVCLFLSGSVQMGQHFAGRLTGGLEILVTDQRASSRRIVCRRGCGQQSESCVGHGCVIRTVMIQKVSGSKSRQVGNLQHLQPP